MLGTNYFVYQNGNYVVSGIEPTYSYERPEQTKRLFRIDETPKPEFPDSIDLKITNACGFGCPWCHENSVPGGQHFDILETISILDKLPKAPIELAIGGGDVFDCPDTGKFIKWCKYRGFRTRVTINRDDLKREDIDLNILRDVGGIGLSISKFDEGLKEISIDGKFICYHIIAGLFPVTDLRKLIKDSSRPILVLGYKQWGRSKGSELPKDLNEFGREVKNIITESRGRRHLVLSFDNLALDQLGIRDTLSDNEFSGIYQGPEGSCSMYIDAVNKEFARSSTSGDRVKWSSKNILDFFKDEYNKVNK